MLSFYFPCSYIYLSLTLQLARGPLDPLPAVYIATGVEDVAHHHIRCLLCDVANEYGHRRT